MRLTYSFSLCLLFLFSYFTINDFKKVNLRKLKGKYVYVPSGILQLQNEKVSISGFYMMSTEVTNLDYKEFLAFLEREGRSEDLEIAQIQSDGSVFFDTYRSHPSYDEYPVLNISKEGAVMYCEYLSDVLSKNGILGKDVKQVKVRLPMKSEWTYAARGGHDLAPYPWGGYYLRNSKGRFLANFRRIGESSITKNRETGEYEIVNQEERSPYLPSITKSFYPNDYGLYNMSGNAAEMVAEEKIAMGGSWNSGGYDIKTTSSMEVKGPSNEVGFRPVFNVTFFD